VEVCVGKTPLSAVQDDAIRGRRKRPGTAKSLDRLCGE